MSDSEVKTTSQDGEAARLKAEERAEAQRRQRLSRLMQSIDAQADFASIKDSVQGIQKITRSELSHARALTDMIHDDTAMVSKLLRLVNAAFYRTAGGGNITSMQRAVQLLGFENIGVIASSLALFDRLPKGADGERLRREFGRAQLAALVAQDFCHSRRQMEGVYLAALFQRLGDMLAGLHFREEAQAIDDQLDMRGLAPGSAARHEAREQLARQQWGVGIEDIAVQVAQQWGWPEKALAGMKALRPADPERELVDNEYLRVLCTAANVLADELVRLPDGDDEEAQVAARQAVLQRFAAEFAGPLKLDPQTLAERVTIVLGAWGEVLQTLGLQRAADGQVASKTVAPKPDPESLAYRQALAESLADAVDELTRMNRRRVPFNEVVETALRMMLKALDLQRAVGCLIEPATGRLKGRFGVGDKALVLAPFFDIALRPPSELFGLLCSKNADTLISDARVPAIAQRLPDWFGQRVRAQAFLVLPLVHEGQVLGMLYGDQAEAGRLKVNDRALTLLKHLRGQVLQSLRAPAMRAG